MGTMPDGRVGGRRSVEFFSALVGLDSQDEWQVVGVTRTKGHYKLPVRRGGEVVATLVILAAEPGAPSFVGSAGLTMVYQGKELPRALADRLQARAFQAHPDATLATLDAVLDGDPEVTAEAP
jgi:hypothetical protein